MTITDRIQEMVAMGVPADLAAQLASQEFARRAEELVVEQSKLAKRTEYGTNENGVPGKLVRCGKGLVSICETPCCVLVPGKGDGKTEYGPSLILHFVEYAGKASIGPKPLWASSGSSSSYNRSVEDSAAWQMAAMIAKQENVRLFIQVERGTDAIEFADRQEWLTEVQAQCEDFLTEVCDAVRDSGMKTRKTGRR